MAKSNKTWDSGCLESSMKALLVTLNGSLLPIPPIETNKMGLQNDEHRNLCDIIPYKMLCVTFRLTKAPTG